MRVQNKRWGEVTIKKQGDRKNKFELTKSFSIELSAHECDIAQMKDLLETVVNLTQLYDFETLRTRISALGEYNE